MGRDWDREGESRFGPLARLVPLILLWAVPVTAVVVSVPLASAHEAAVVAPPLPSVVTVGSQSTDYKASVSVEVEVENLGDVLSPVSGVLTALSAPAGEVAAGEELFAVNGIPILAQPGTAPLYRELRLGHTGSDVETLGKFLADAGFLETELIGIEFGTEMMSAVVRLQERIGVPPDGTFRPTYVAFVPEQTGSISTRLTVVGATVSPGTPVLATSPVAARITFTSTGNGASLTNLKGAPLKLTFGGKELAVSSLSPPEGDLADLYAALREAATEGDARLTSDSGERQTFDGGLLSLATPDLRATVPGVAVYLNEDGAQCLFEELGDDNWGPVPLDQLEPAAGTLGIVYVDPSLTGTRVARDPLILDEQTRSACT